VFTPNGSGGFVTPTQFRATLKVATGGGWTLTQHRGGDTLTFTVAGRLAQDTDRSGNITTFTLDGSGNPATIVSTRGPVAGRTLTVHTSGGRITSLTQASGTLSRTVGLGYTSLGNLGSVTDAVSGVTSFSSGGGTDTGQLVVLTNPKNATTTLSFAAGKVSAVDQSNTAPGSPGTSTTRLTYPSTAQTLVADPTTNQTQTVAAVPHTTYDLYTDGSQLVHFATDADNNKRTTTYSPLQDVASRTGAAGTAAATTSFAHDTAVAVASDVVLTDLLDAETGQRGFLLTGQPSYLEPYHRAVGALPVDLRRLSVAAVDLPQAGGDVGRLGALAARKLEELSRTFAAAQAGDRRLRRAGPAAGPGRHRASGLAQFRPAYTSAVFASRCGQRAVRMVRLGSCPRG
jgi:YD repeat-containing protein